MKRLQPIPGAGAGPMFNQILNGRFGDVLTRMFWVRSAGAPAPSLSPEIQASIDVNQQDDPTAFFLRAESLWAAPCATPVAGAGNTVKCVVQNPVGSGIVTIVDRIEWSTDIAGDVYLEMLLAPVAGTAVRVQRRDTRFTNTVPATSAVAINDATVVPQAGALLVLARYLTGAVAGGKINVIEQRGMAILRPGTGLRLGNATAVTPTLYATFFGRERALTAEENSTG